MTKAGNFLVIMAIVALGAALMSCDTLEKAKPAVPEIVSKEMSRLSSSPTDYKIEIKAMIKNTGGEGDVVFESTLTQGDEKWTKTVTHRMKPEEESEFSLVFEEVTLGGGKPSYEVKTYPDLF